MFSGHARADQSQDIAEMKAMMIEMQKTIVQLQGQVTTLQEKQRRMEEKQQQPASPLAGLKQAILPAKPKAANTESGGMAGSPPPPAVTPPPPAVSERPMVFNDVLAGPLPLGEWSEPRYAGFHEINDSGWWIHVGGTLKTDAFFWSNEANDTFYNNLTISQSRVHVDLRSDSDLGAVRLYYETTFNWNVRHLYAQIGGLTFGQTWSAFYDPSAAPDTLDYTSPVLQGYRLRPQIRYTFPSSNEHFHLTMAVESSTPETVYAPFFGNGGTLSSRIPSVLMQARWEHDNWHLQVAGVLRDAHYSTSTDDDEDTLGYGLSITGAYHLSERDHLMAGASAGNGVAYYITDLGGYSASAGPSNELDLHEAWSAFIGYQHLWNEKWRSQVSLRHESIENMNVPWSDNNSDRDILQANLIWKVSDQLSAGIEYQGHFLNYQTADDEYFHILMFSLMYRFF